MTENQLPEAPASATLSVVTPKGYNTLFTLREMSGTELLKKIALVEVKLEELGYKPQVKMAFGQKKEVKYVEGFVCPKDKGRLIEMVTKSGKKAWKCENQKYDFATKQTSGCTYMKWLDENPQPQKPVEENFDVPGEAFPGEEDNHV